MENKFGIKDFFFLLVLLIFGVAILLMFVNMDRHWLITWTCYGTWLPGDARGFVGNVREEDGTQVSHNLPGTPVDVVTRNQ